MLIGGLTPCSFIDFPGELAAVVFTQGCNLRCAYCHNPGLVRSRGPQHLDPEEVLGFLATRADRLGGVVVTGGEPLLHHDLADFLSAIRDLGLRTKLDSNGTQPDRLAAILKAGLVDYLAIDVKDLPGHPPRRGPVLAGATLPTCVGLVRDSGVEHEFRTTVVEALHDEERLFGIAELLRGSQRWFLQRVRPDRGQLYASLPCTPPADSLLQRVVAHADRLGLTCGIR